MFCGAVSKTCAPPPPLHSRGDCLVIPIFRHIASVRLNVYNLGIDLHFLIR